MRRTAVPTLALVAALAACPSKGGDIRIGVVGPLSGPLAYVGEEQKRGAEIAAKEINDAGGVKGRRIRLIVRDDADRARLTGIVRDLTGREKVSAIVGPELATPLLARNSPTARTGTPVLLTYATLGDPVRGMFRLLPGATLQAKALAGWLVRIRKLTTVAIAVGSDQEYRAQAALFEEAMKAAGGRIVAKREFAPGAPDQTALVRPLQRSGASTLAIYGHPADAARVLLAAGRIRWRPQVAGPADLYHPDFRSLAGRTTDGVVVPAPFRRDLIAPNLLSFLQQYLRKFGLQPIPKQRTLVPAIPVVAMVSYDAVKMIAEAAKARGSKPPEVRDGLESIKDFAGVGGRYTFGRDRREAYTIDQVYAARFYNFAILYDADPRAERNAQIAFYKIQVSALSIGREALESGNGASILNRILEEVLTNPDQIEYFIPYKPPRPPPGPL